MGRLGAIGKERRKFQTVPQPENQSQEEKEGSEEYEAVESDRNDSED